MSDDIFGNDVTLTSGDIRGLENPETLAKFFHYLGYDVSNSGKIDHSAINMDTQDMRYWVDDIYTIGTDPQDRQIEIYLFIVHSLTAKLRQDIARHFRNSTSQKVLLVLTTSTYDELEFVLLDRSINQKTMNPIVRPIPLTVNRQNPDTVHLRVLRRFTVTESDADYQWDKLRSAYTLAEWSEHYFNNRALFSDYYLNHRLTDKKLTPEWDSDEAVRPIFQSISGLLAHARRDYTRQPEAIIRQNLFEPLFTLLGFEHNVQKPAHSSDLMPDYLLYTPNDPSKPIANVLTYVWNRNLDDVDETRDPQTPKEIPGALVVSLLEAQAVPWVIVTNGKLWRLYSTSTSNKATNYYEVDLEEALSADPNDRVTAFKYWWLMFRASAFTGFLDKVQKGSADYAKELRERLKDTIFEDIFPQFARGFIENMRQQGITDFSEAQLATVFDATMFFLYRMMFVLYAESLDLLPVNEHKGYREFSAYHLKKEISDIGSVSKNSAPSHIQAHYSPTSTDLYTRLTELFTYIDKGAPDQNIPTYNGGLFSPKTPEGRFLATYAIPDQFLALGLDKLARDEDTRTKSLEFIDFKSLGVRQLGSIYEGLLEFKLHIAIQRLEIIKEKGKEVYVPHIKATDPKKIIEIGDVYLENDKRERKATGSYYTPDYIVKYIVQHTVGPVLERKFEALRPRLHKAQGEYRQYKKSVESRKNSLGKAESADVFWNTDTMRHLADDCLNIRVLDPAMGSGHFLVDVVDYISNRVNDFLNAWSENPVWALLEQTKRDILADMERQGVTIDETRLTRVALLKRAVLKRCVYGVDLNKMAVELAKVSLWLNAFTLGAPLSFLDHHLKWGNSLIGARINDVKAYLSGGEAPATTDMFSRSEFAGVMLATDLMQRVSFLSDNTIAQVEESKHAYDEALAHLIPFKRLLDVYTSRWFGNPPADDSAKKKKSKADNLLLFLKDDKTADWLKNPDTVLDDTLLPANKMATIATTARTEKRFFHWELEFPEIFFAPSTAGANDVHLLEDGGFDAVVGNPPYGLIGKDFYKYLEANYTMQNYQIDMYMLFLENSLNMISQGSFVGWVIPNTWLINIFSNSLRQKILNTSAIKCIVHYQNKVFDEATVDVEIMIFEKNIPTENHNILISMRDNLDILNEYNTMQFDWIKLNGQPINIFLSEESKSILSKLDDVGLLDVNFKVTQGAKPFQVGKGNPPQIREIVTRQPFVANYQKDSTFRPLLRGGLIQRYSILWNNDYWIKFGDWLAEPRYSAGYDAKAKIVIRQTGDSIIATIDTSQFIVRDNLYTILPISKDISLYFCLALLNSSVIQWIYQRTINYEVGEALAQIKASHIRQIPLRKIDFTTPADERHAQTTALISAYDHALKTGNSAQFLNWKQEVYGSIPSDVVHDFLAFLAERMIALNQQKQAEVNRFLDWVMKTMRLKAGVSLDDLKGKTILQGYLGDYQKGQGETAWKEFSRRLVENRGVFEKSLTDVEEKIRAEYEQSLAVLRPIKDALSQTDMLIDKIVYRLYGLSDDEIELIERPAFQQSLTDVKADVVKNDKLDDEEKVEALSEGILSLARRYFARVDPQQVALELDKALPNWQNLPPEAPKFLQTGEYILNTFPDDMDFSSSIIPFTKAVEVVLAKRIFEPFRQQHTDGDCENEFLKKYMAGIKELTLVNFMIILASSKEKALRDFVQNTVSNMAGLLVLIKDNMGIGNQRNDAAHDVLFGREDARAMREWAIAVLRTI
ncbi:MAG: TaqI-like C-terminal specificity domain-containing protein [bacterium]|nr:TaqI-like C-terminal specificity domain-containing protein [bacterium]